VGVPHNPLLPHDHRGNPQNSGQSCKSTIKDDAECNPHFLYLTFSAGSGFFHQIIPTGFGLKLDGDMFHAVFILEEAFYLPQYLATFADQEIIN